MYSIMIKYKKQWTSLGSHKVINICQNISVFIKKIFMHSEHDQCFVWLFFPFNCLKQFILITAVILAVLTQNDTTHTLIFRVRSFIICLRAKQKCAIFAWISSTYCRLKVLFIANRTNLLLLETNEAKLQNYYSQLKALCCANTVYFVHGWHGISRKI